MIGLALGALPLVVLYLYVEEPLVNRPRELTELLTTLTVAGYLLPAAGGI
jgi:hypothetical protein